MKSAIVRDVTFGFRLGCLGLVVLHVHSVVIAINWNCDQSCGKQICFLLIYLFVFSVLF